MFYRWWFFPLQCSNGKGRAQWEGVEIYPLFRPLRLEWCQKIDTNPCQSLALKDVNLCVKYVAGVWQEKWGTNASMTSSGDFPIFQDETVACLHCPRGGFIIWTSTNAWLKDWALLVPSLSRPQVRVSEDVLRKPWVEIAMENGEIRVDPCSKTSMFILFPRVLVSTCQY